MKENKCCNRCSEGKPPGEFYANDRTCKECRKALVRANRAKNIDYYQQYDRDRMARLKEENPEAYFGKIRGKGTPESRAKAKSDYSKRNRHKTNAKARLKTAVDNGTLVRPDRCERCNELKFAEAHHPDYSKALEVVWLCDACHKKAHVEEREAARVAKRAAKTAIV